MDRQLIKALIDALAASDLSELEYSRDGSTLRLVKGGAASGTAPAASSPGVASGAAPGAAAASPAGVVPPPGPGPASAAVVTAPSFGVVHLARSPGAPPLAVPGQRVAAGEALCLIEAMKVFTPLPAPADATVEAVLVADGQEVDAGQPLFRFAP